MKLLLTSAGFTTDEIIQTCVELVGKPKDEISFSIINEGYIGEPGNHDWVIDDLNNLVDNFKGEIEFANLFALNIDQIIEVIDRRDVIFVLGGNTDYLMYAVNQCGLSERLPELLERHVYIGSSAGSMILGNRASAKAYQEIYDEEAYQNIIEYLGLVDACIKPHLDSPHVLNNRRDRLVEVCADLPGTVYALKDDSAIVVDGDIMRFIGSEPLTIIDGQLTEGLAA